MEKRDIPPHWRHFMATHSVGSLRALAEMAGTSHGTITRMVHGDGTPTDATLLKIAEAFGVSLGDMYELVGRDADTVEVWVPPEEANQLTRKQRHHIEGLIKAIVNAD